MPKIFRSVAILSLAVALGLESVAAQNLKLPPLPSCATGCFNDAVKASKCSSSNANCICNSNDFYDSVMECIFLENKCGYYDIDGLLAYGLAYCQRAGASSAAAQFAVSGTSSPAVSDPNTNTNTQLSVTSGQSTSVVSIPSLLPSSAAVAATSSSSTSSATESSIAPVQAETVTQTSATVTAADTQTTGTTKVETSTTFTSIKIIYPPSGTGVASAASTNSNTVAGPEVTSTPTPTPSPGTSSSPQTHTQPKVIFYWMILAFLASLFVL